MNSFTLDLDGGKYTYRFNNGKQDALRYGEPWRDLCGDNLVYWLAVEVRSYREACGGLVIPGDAPPGLLADAVKALRGLYQIMSQDVMKQAGGLVFQDYGLLNDSLGGAQDVLAALNNEPVSPEPEGKQPAFHREVMSLPPEGRFLRLSESEAGLLLGLVEAGLAAHSDFPPGDNIFRRKAAEMLPVFQSIKAKLETP